MQSRYEKVVVVTRATELEELIERFNSESQARFYLEHAGQNFEPVAQAHRLYHSVLDNIGSAIPERLKRHVIERKYLPQYKFEKSDLVVVIGIDGLVVNTAKYLDGQPIIAVNPDPAHIDGVLLPFNSQDFADSLNIVLSGKENISNITLAESVFSNGRKLLAFNDFFVGAKSHISARYEISQNGKTELHSSSGIIVSTGAGSTGWMRSVYTGALAVTRATGAKLQPPPNEGRLPWDTQELVYAVREPFPSKITGTSIVFGKISKKNPLVVRSHMAQNGVVFSDGIESDFVSFNAGETVTVSTSDKVVRLVNR
jgi:NAD kinase